MGAHSNSNAEALLTDCPDGTSSAIADFYKNRSILITGASGFIGKQLLEKLLRSCSNLKKIYILLRDSHHASASERLKHILSSALFCRLWSGFPDFESKIQVIRGDVAQPDFGISDEDKETILSEVSIVFHLAATISFNEPLRKAVNINVIGLQRLLEMCKQMKKLEACVHVSTAYTNCHIQNEIIMEKVYKPHVVSPNQILEAMKWMNDDILKDITDRIISSHPNTYAFTKAIAEQMLLDERDQLPVAIFRPSIVTASVREPFPGWVDNMNGATGIISAMGCGFVKAMYGGKHKLSDLVPVDLTANVLIAVAWHTATHRAADEVPIYNFTSGTLNPITWKEIGECITDQFRRYPIENPFWIPYGYVTENWYLRTFSLYVEVYLRLLGIDLIYRLVGKKPRMLRIHSRVIRMVKLLEYFTSRQWLWSNDSVVQLFHSLSESDKQTFNFDIQSVVWKEYLESYCLGIRQHALHQNQTTIPHAKRVLQWIFYIRRICLFGMSLLFIRLVIAKAETAPRLWKFMTSMFTAFLQKMPMIARAS